MARERTIAAETGSPRRSGDPGPRAERPGTEVPRPAPAKPRAADMRTTEVRTATSHPAAEMTAAAKVTAAAKMRSAAAMAASATSRRRIGRTRNHDGKNNNGQEIEL